MQQNKKINVLLYYQIKTTPRNSKKYVSELFPKKKKRSRPRKRARVALFFPSHDKFKYRNKF